MTASLLFEGVPAAPACAKVKFADGSDVSRVFWMTVLAAFRTAYQRTNSEPNPLARETFLLSHMFIAEPNIKKTTSFTRKGPPRDAPRQA